MICFQDIFVKMDEAYRYMTNDMSHSCFGRVFAKDKNKHLP